MLPHSRISRRHCCVAQIAGGLVIRDLESRTGIRVNGHPVEETSIEEGDEIAIGPLVFRLEGEHVPLDARSPAKAPGPIPQVMDEDALVPLEDD